MDMRDRFQAAEVTLQTREPLDDGDLCGGDGYHLCVCFGGHH